MIGKGIMYIGLYWQGVIKLDLVVLEDLNVMIKKFIGFILGIIKINKSITFLISSFKLKYISYWIF